MVAVIGHMNSGVSIPAAKIYSDAGIAEISPSTTHPAYTQKGFKTTSVSWRPMRCRVRGSRVTRSRRCTRRKSSWWTTPALTGAASLTSSSRPCRRGRQDRGPVSHDREGAQLQGDPHKDQAHPAGRRHVQRHGRDVRPVCEGSGGGHQGEDSGGRRRMHGRARATRCRTSCARRQGPRLRNWTRVRTSRRNTRRTFTSQFRFTRLTCTTRCI